MTIHERLDIWTVYDGPRDYPGKVMARLHVAEFGEHSGQVRATERIVVADDVDGVRAQLPDGLTRLAPDPGDDPTIVEVWI